MLTNCKPTTWPIAKELSFSFTGRSMINISSMVLAEQSIFHDYQWKGTTLVCEAECVLTKVINGVTPIEGNRFVVMSFFDEPFVAEIKKVESSYLMFGFYNPDKSAFPNQFLRIDEIKSLHMVDRIVYDRTSVNWCYCASEGDYCGKWCHQPNNQLILKGGASC